jgi:benzoate membrane transport protein
MAVGIVLIALTRTGTLPPIDSGTVFAAPVFVVPHFNAATLVELVVPLAITVLVVQNGQGIAVLRSTGHEPPVNAIGAACGLWSIFAGLVGTVSTCLTGPTNAILSTGRDKRTHYAAGILVGLLALVFGLFSPLFTKLLLATPPAFIATLAGLAMLRVLQGAFATSAASPSRASARRSGGWCSARSSRAYWSARTSLPAPRPGIERHIPFRTREPTSRLRMIWAQQL